MTFSLALEAAPADEEGGFVQTEALAPSAQSANAALVLDDDIGEDVQAEENEIDISLHAANKAQVTSPATLFGSSGEGPPKATRSQRKLTNQEKNDASEKLVEGMEDEQTRAQWAKLGVYEKSVKYVARGIVISTAQVGASTCVRESKPKCVWDLSLWWRPSVRCGCPQGYHDYWWHPQAKCWKTCADGITLFDHDCLNMSPVLPLYCSHAPPACAAFILNVIVDMGMVAANMMPATKAVTSAAATVKIAYKAGGLAATTAPLKILLTKMAKEFLSASVKSYLESQLDSALKKFLDTGNDIEAIDNGEETLNIFHESIMQRAAESVGQQILANAPDEYKDFRGFVANFNGLDPTGITAVVNTLWKSDCATHRNDNPPAENPATCGNPNPWICDFGAMLFKGFAAIPCPDVNNPDSCTNAVCCLTTTTTTQPPGICNSGYYAEWSAGSSRYECGRCYGSVRRRRALSCTACSQGRVSSKNDDDCKAGGPPPLKTTCKRHDDCYDDYWKWPKVLCTNHGCKEQSR